MSTDVHSFWIYFRLIKSGREREKKKLTNTHTNSFSEKKCEAAYC